MIRKPVIKSNYRIEIVPNDCIILLSETRKHLIDGGVNCAVFLLIDGIRTPEDIVLMLQATIPAKDVLASLDYFEKQGFLQEANPFFPKTLSAFWSELNVDIDKLPAVLARYAIQVIGVDGINPEPAIAALQSLGFNVSPVGNVILALCNDYSSPQLSLVNDYCLTNKLAWMIVKPTGVNSWIGPILVPGKTACWKCLEDRIRHNREVEDYIERRKNYVIPISSVLGNALAAEQIAINLAAMQFARWLIARFNDLESNIMIMDPFSININRHVVVKRPQCPKCGNPELAKTGGTPIVFHSRAADTGTDAGYRAEPPETTFSRYAFHISPVTGIVKSVIPSPWNNMGPLKIYTAGHNLAIKNENLFFLKNNLRTNSSGKGRTDSQARTSALCEAIERYSGLYKGEESRITSTFNRLKDAAIHPNNCMLFSEEQYLKRNEWNSKGEQFSIVPLPFDKNNEIEWSPVYSYTQKKIKYLPTAYLYYAYPIPFDKAFTLADSNGNAAGSCFEDACLQGLLEVVERDSMAIWWYNRLRKPGFDLASLNDAYINEVIEFYKKYNREFWVLDITTDIGIPAFAALNRRTSGPTEDIMFGLGCHVDARTAINRAITEMNQFMPAVLNTLPDSETNYQWGDPAAIKWWKTVTVKNQEYLTPDPAHTKTIKDYKEIKDRDILKYLEQCISKMESLGHEVLILNQTRPDIGLDVVKVIIPGMRHFWTRFAPGRLYDVPVKMGWLKKKKTEAELNPIAMFL